MQPYFTPDVSHSNKVCKMCPSPVRQGESLCPPCTVKAENFMRGRPGPEADAFREEMGLKSIARQYGGHLMGAVIQVCGELLWRDIARERGIEP